MRTWRVGTVSMGISLLVLGVYLLVSQFNGMELKDVLLSWWPVLLIVLGVEIILYFILQGKENLIKYDVFSIIFIGFLGTVGIGFAVLSSVGIVDKASAMISSEEVTLDLPEFYEELADHIDRIVVETNRQDSLSIEGSEKNVITLFGTYETQARQGDKPLLEEYNEYMSVREHADTLFITLKELPTGTSWDTGYSRMSPILVVPVDIDLEVRAKHSSVTIRSREVASNWRVEEAGYVSLYIPSEGDFSIIPTGVQSYNGLYEIDEMDVDFDGNYEEDVVVKEEMDSEGERVKTELVYGDGTHLIKIVDSYGLNVVEAY